MPAVCTGLATLEARAAAISTPAGISLACTLEAEQEQLTNRGADARRETAGRMGQGRTWAEATPRGAWPRCDAPRGEHQDALIIAWSAGRGPGARPTRWGSSGGRRPLAVRSPPHQPRGPAGGAPTRRLSVTPGALVGVPVVRTVGNVADRGWKFSRVIFGAYPGRGQRRQRSGMDLNTAKTQEKRDSDW